MVLEDCRTTSPQKVCVESIVLHQQRNVNQNKLGRVCKKDTKRFDRYFDKAGVPEVELVK